MDELNAAQRQAVEAGEGPILITAGPGTGKTKTLTARIVYLLRERHIDPRHIVALTFTNKAAREMHERVAAQMPKKAVLPRITTFHALGCHLLPNRDEWHLANEADRVHIIRSLPRPQGFARTRELALLISRAKTAVYSPPSPNIRQLLEKYNQALAAEQLLDFDDMLAQAYQLLRQNDIPRYEYVLVDEFQDTSELQYELLRALTSGQNIFAIGDRNQAIYSFRGAGSGMFDRFQHDFPRATHITLTDNYRSAPPIVALANAIFPESSPQAARRDASGHAQAVQTYNEYSEASYILEQIEQAIGGSTMLKAAGDGQGQLRDYAVLYRTHRSGVALRRAFAESGIPFQIAGEDSPYEQPVVQALILLMRRLQDPGQPPIKELLRHPLLRNYTVSQIDTILGSLSLLGHTDVTEVCRRLAELFGWNAKEQMATLCQLGSTLVQFGRADTGIARCLAYFDNIREQAFYDPDINAVTLLTIHASKGLEFEHVFLCAAEDGILPKHTGGKSADIDEERRLLYVAATRARGQLDIMYAKRRGGEPARLSPFVSALPPAVLPRVPDPRMAELEQSARRRRQKRAQTSLF